MIGRSRAALALWFALGSVLIPGLVQAQTNNTPAKAGNANQADNRASAYYNYAMAHLYAELAGAYGNRGEYVNKAIDSYKEAIRLDPQASYIDEELTEFYVQAGQLDKATQEAENLLKADPNNVNARRILARIYSRQIGDPDQGRVDETMLKSAIEQYQKVVEQDPKDTESLSMLARLYRASHDDAAAEKAYRQVLQTDPSDDDALNGLAMVLADRGDMDGAISLLKQAVAQNADPRTVVMLAELYDQQKDYADAANTWQQALELTNDNVRVRRKLAEDLYLAGRYDDALKSFQALAAEDPKNVQLQLQVAELLERKHDYEGARGAIAKAKAINNSTEVRYAEAELMRAQGQIPQAIAAIQSIVADTKKDNYTDAERGERLQMLESLGSLQELAGKTQDAIASYRQIADLDPTLASRVEIQVIGAYENAKDFKGARQEADSALKKFPGDRAVAFEHAQLLSDLGQADAAISEVRALPKIPNAKESDLLITIAQFQDKAKRFEDEKKTLDAAENVAKTPQEKLQIDFVRGAMYEREKNFDAAEREFRTVLATDPNNANALNYLGYMFADRGVKLEEAQELITKALNIDPDSGAYLDSLGWVHFHQNRLDQAADELKQALDRIGKDPTVHEHLGDVYFAQGKFRDAIQQWEASVSEWKIAAPGDQDPEELAKVTKKLESAKTKAAEKR